MNKIAFVFSGQGAQKAGMGKDFYEHSEIAKNIFDTASEKLELDLRKLCFEENDLLDKTEYTQAALVTRVSLPLQERWRKEDCMRM